MNKKVVGILAVVILAVIAGYFFLKSDVGENAPLASGTVAGQSGFDPKNVSFEIEGKKVILVNGFAETEYDPGSASKVTTRYFGNDVAGDLNGDGQNDVAFLVTQDGGGTGLFYYAVVALKTSAGYKMTNAFFIGDRIAPQSNYINSSMELHINYAERKADEPMVATPSVGAVKLLKVTPEGRLTGLME
jgi:hypothetical protein